MVLGRRDLRIVTEEGEVLPPETAGLLQCRGIGLMKEYWRNGPATAGDPLGSLYPLTALSTGHKHPSLCGAPCCRRSKLRPAWKPADLRI